MSNPTSQPWKTHHVTISLAYMLRASEEELSGMLNNRETGEPVTAAEAKALAAEWQAKGYTYLPVCDNPGKDGLCQGHDPEA